MRLRPGDIIYVNRGRLVGRVAVLSTSRRKGGMKVQVLTTGGVPVNLSARDFSESPRPLGHIELPTPYAPNRHQFQRQVARLLTKATVRSAGPSRRGRRPRPSEDEPSEPLADHPVAADPRLAERLRAAGQADRAAREVDDLRTRIQGRSQSVSHRFDRVLRILETWGYVDGWALTDGGRRLAGFFHECDLLVVECLRQGLLDGLEPAELAGLASVFCYEHRSPEPPPAPWFPSRDVRKRWEAIESLAGELRQAEEEAGVPVDPGTRPHVRLHRPRLGVRAVLRQRRGGRGAVGRRLRAHGQAAHRPAAPARPPRPGRGHAAGGAGRVRPPVQRGGRRLDGVERDAGRSRRLVILELS